MDYLLKKWEIGDELVLKFNEICITFFCVNDGGSKHNSSGEASFCEKIGLDRSHKDQLANGEHKKLFRFVQLKDTNPTHLQLSDRRGLDKTYGKTKIKPHINSHKVGAYRCSPDFAPEYLKSKNITDGRFPYKACSFEYKSKAKKPKPNSQTIITNPGYALGTCDDFAEAIPRNFILEFYKIIRNYQKKNNVILFGEMFNKLILDRFIDNFDEINTINDDFRTLVEQMEYHTGENRKSLQKHFENIKSEIEILVNKYENISKNRKDGILNRNYNKYSRNVNTNIIEETASSSSNSQPVANEDLQSETEIVEPSSKRQRL